MLNAVENHIVQETLHRKRMQYSQASLRLKKVSKAKTSVATLRLLVASGCDQAKG